MTPLEQFNTRGGGITYVVRPSGTGTTQVPASPIDPRYPAEIKPASGPVQPGAAPPAQGAPPALGASIRPGFKGTPAQTITGIPMTTNEYSTAQTVVANLPQSNDPSFDAQAKSASQRLAALLGITPAQAWKLVGEMFKQSGKK
jgi:hypothetical protein